VVLSNDDIVDVCTTSSSVVNTVGVVDSDVLAVVKSGEVNKLAVVEVISVVSVTSASVMVVESQSVFPVVGSVSVTVNSVVNSSSVSSINKTRQETKLKTVEKFKCC
jgi:hypothetical protein